MEMKTRIRPILLTSVTALLAAWLSYRQAYQAESPVARTEPESTSPANGRQRRERNPARADKMEQLRGLMKRPSTTRNAADAWEIISGMSIGQIKQALDGISEESATDAGQGIEMMLYFCWAQIDPQEAVEAAVEEGKRKWTDPSMNEQQLLFSAFSAWSKRDPEAAFQWVQSSDIPDRKFFINQIGKYLSTLTPGEAAERAKAYGTDVQKAVLVHQANGMTATPESRQAFLDAVAASGIPAGDSNVILKQFARNWGYADSAAALAGLDGFPLDDEQKAQARQWIMAGWAEKDPADAIAWVVKENSPDSMRKQVDIYKKWADNWPGEAADSLDALSLQSPGLREEVMKSQLTSYYQESWIPFGRNEGADAYLLSRLKTHYDHWSAATPADAAKWLESLEPSLREKLQTHADEKR